MSHEVSATALVAQLEAASLDVRIQRDKVHWRIEVGSSDARGVRVDCFWLQHAHPGVIFEKRSAEAREAVPKPASP